MARMLLSATFALAMSFTAMTAGMRDASAGNPPCDENTLEPSAAYPFIDKYVRVNGHRIHYIERGPRDGKPLIFIHGNPTWSYLWRNVVPCVAEQTQRRVFAIDLLGMGRSDKPALNYTPRLHAEVLRQFINKLGLKDVILVGHDWGGPIMTGYAVNHPRNVEGLVFVETFAWLLEVSDFGSGADFVRLTRSPQGRRLLMDDPDWFLDNLIAPLMGNRVNMTAEVRARYLEPFPTAQSRTAMIGFPLLLPIVDDPHTPQVSLDYFKDIEAKRAVLADKALLVIRADPGAALSELSFHKLQAMASVLPNLEIRDFGSGLHFVQEENPGRLVRLISDWIRENRLEGCQPERQDR